MYINLNFTPYCSFYKVYILAGGLQLSLSKLYTCLLSSHLHCDNTLSSSSHSISLVPRFVLLIHIYWKAFLCTHPSFSDGWRVRVGFLLARLISQMECQQCTGCIKSSWSRNSILRAKEHKEMWGKKEKLKLPLQLYGFSGENDLWKDSSCILCWEQWLYLYNVQQFCLFVHASVPGVCCWRIHSNVILSSL